MNGSYFRSGQTNLSEDELLILDILSKYEVSFRMLGQNGVNPCFGFKPHTMDKSTLAETIRKWLGKGIIRISEYSCESQIFELTNLGGELWEAERKPVWERYCSEHYGSSRKGRVSMTVQAVSRHICEDFLKMWLPNEGRKKILTIRDKRFLYWKSFGTISVGLMSYEESLDKRPVCADAFAEEIALLETAFKGH